MNGLTDSRPPLPAWIVDAYETLVAHGHNAGKPQNRQAIPRENALEVLRNAEQLNLDAGDAVHTLSGLINRGYLYEVDGELRVTISET
ncbi:hypothetical protein [Halostagnicola bangensis]